MKEAEKGYPKVSKKDEVKLKDLNLILCDISAFLC